MTLGMFNFILDGATIAVGFWFVIKIFLAVMSRNSFMVTAKRHKYKSTRLQVIGMWKSRHIRFCGMLVIFCFSSASIVRPVGAQPLAFSPYNLPVFAS